MPAQPSRQPARPAAEALAAAVADARAGNPRGFEDILLQMGPRLYGYFLWAAGNSHDAEDLLGELTVRLVAGLRRYRECDRFEPWLFRIAANLVRDRIRHARCRPAPLSLSSPSDDDPVLSLPAFASAAPDPFLAAEQSDRLHAVLDTLNPVTRGMILLRYFGRMSFRDLADTFGCSVPLALVRVHRGLRSLRRHIASSDRDRRALQNA